MAVADRATVEVARALAYAAAVAWWQASVEACGGGTLPAVALPPGIAPPPLSLFAAADAKAFGRNLARLPPAEALVELGGLYTTALPVAHRARHCIFYTPPILVRRVLDQAERAGHNWLVGQAIDPSCGVGAFLVEAASRMLSAMEAVDSAIALAVLGARLKGWDTDPFAV